MEILDEARIHLEYALQYWATGDPRQLVIDAVCMRLSAGIEVLARLDDGVRTELFGADWPLMWGMRNRIAHGYLLVNRDIVAQTLELDVPTMLTAIDRGITAARRRP